MIPLAPGYDARMSMAWLRSLAVIVAIIGALLLLASGLGVRLGPGGGLGHRRYATEGGPDRGHGDHVLVRLHGRRGGADHPAAGRHPDRRALEIPGRARRYGH